MKHFTSLLSFTALILLSACNNNNTAKEEKAVSDSNKKTTVAGTDQPKDIASVDPVIDGYLALKNALTKDQGSEAATAAKQTGDAVEKVNESSLLPDQKKVFDDIKDDIKEHCEHIGSNASNITHQREHFDMLSQDMIQLVNATGTAKTLYNDFCPMYNEKKGAYWLSETKEIRNPYYGQQMPTCGELKGEMKPRK